MLRFRLYTIIKNPNSCLNKSQWYIGEHWKKEKMIQINNFKNTEVFTNKITYETEIVFSA